MSTFDIIYTFFGGLGIFFYGMKSMSDALQAVAGDVIQRIINSLTSNRVFAILVGVFVTMIVQSSSITTVMVVGMVNAGLMNLIQALGIILGANIGTTITGWIISIKIGHYGLLLVALGTFPGLFAKNPKIKLIGKALFGVGMVFFGLETMSDSFRPLRDNPNFLHMLSYFSGENYFGYFFSILIGCMLTMVIQSSSAMLGITMALAGTGVIHYHTAAALVLGENVGTTITAILASIGGNINAKRAALGHAIFNLTGVLVLFSFFPRYLEFVDWFVPGDANFTDALGNRPYMSVHIASAHSFFNILTTLFFLPLLGQLCTLVKWIIKDKDNEKEKYHFVVLGDPQAILPSVAIAQAQQEITKMREIVGKMFLLTREYFSSDKKNVHILNKIQFYEKTTDTIQKEITVFISKVMQQQLTSFQSLQLQTIIKLADELESAADYLEKLTIYRNRLTTNELPDGESMSDLIKLARSTFDFFNLCTHKIKIMDIDNFEECENKSQELFNMAEHLRDGFLSHSRQMEIKPLVGMTISDMASAIRKIRGHSYNMAVSLHKLQLARDDDY